MNRVINYMITGFILLTIFNISFFIYVEMSIKSIEKRELELWDYLIKTTTEVKELYITVKEYHSKR